LKTTKKRVLITFRRQPIDALKASFNFRTQRIQIKRRCQAMVNASRFAPESSKKMRKGINQNVDFGVTFEGLKMNLQIGKCRRFVLMIKSGMMD
jgi:hypothetical protein